MGNLSLQLLRRLELKYVIIVYYEKDCSFIYNNSKYSIIQYQQITLANRPGYHKAS